MMARSAAARKVLRELHQELESASKRANKKLEFSAAERAVLELISANLDRISDLKAAYAEAEEPKLRIKLSTEMRLLETNVARLLKQVKTDLPAPESTVTLAARRAANTRWDKARAANQ
jgi:hypothetical protein